MACPGRTHGSLKEKEVFDKEMMSFKPKHNLPVRQSERLLSAKRIDLSTDSWDGQLLETPSLIEARSRTKETFNCL